MANNQPVTATQPTCPGGASTDGFAKKAMVATATFAVVSILAGPVMGAIAVVVSAIAGPAVGKIAASIVNND